jgi:hypothetical protein
VSSRFRLACLTPVGQNVSIDRRLTKLICFLANNRSLCSMSVFWERYLMCSAVIIAAWDIAVICFWPVP